MDFADYGVSDGYLERRRRALVGWVGFYGVMRAGVKLRTFLGKHACLDVQVIAEGVADEIGRVIVARFKIHRVHVIAARREKRSQTAG